MRFSRWGKVKPLNRIAFFISASLASPTSIIIIIIEKNSLYHPSEVDVSGMYGYLEVFQFLPIFRSSWGKSMFSGLMRYRLLRLW